jgi:beta-N-acetylhexosaminidase
MEPNQLLVVGIPGPELSPGEIRLLRDLQPGGFLVEAAGLVDIAQARRLTDALRAISVNEPLLVLRPDDGAVWPRQLLESAAPSPGQLRDNADSKRIMTAGWIAGRLLRVLGFNVHLAPDLRIGPWGRDDQEVINHAGTFNRYQRKQGILGAGGAFPGGASCAGLDTGALLRSPLLPFTALMPELDGILLSNRTFPKIDPGQTASRSRPLITRLLRDQLGYQRLVFAETGDPASIEAGADLVMVRDAGAAPEILAHLDMLSGYTLSDAIDRLEDARKRLHQPTPPEPGILDRLQEDARILNDLR